jgi:hypothetical protein
MIVYEHAARREAGRCDTLRDNQHEPLIAHLRLGDGIVDRVVVHDDALSGVAWPFKNI